MVPGARHVAVRGRAPAPAPPRVARLCPDRRPLRRRARAARACVRDTEVDYEAAEEEEEPAAAADEEAAAADGAAAAADEDDDDDEEDLETMKARLKEMEAEAAKLQEMQNKVEQEMGTDKAAGEGEGGAAGANAASREEVDARSVYVGNVDYAVTPEELQVHFQSCGTVNRVTILSDRFGNPKVSAMAWSWARRVRACARALPDGQRRARESKHRWR